MEITHYGGTGSLRVCTGQYAGSIHGIRRTVRGGQRSDRDHGGKRGYAAERQDPCDKNGEEFSSVQVSGDGVVDKDGNLAEGENIYTPVYAVTGQAGAYMK